VAQDSDARRVHRHRQHRLLRVTLRLEIGLAHDDRDLAARIARARRPPFDAVDDIIVAVAFDPRLDVRRVGRGDLRLGHQEGGADFAVHQRLQPALLLRGGAIAVEHFHIAGVWRGAVEHFAGKADAAHLLGAQRIFEVGQAGSLELEAVVDMVVRGAARRHEQVPDARGLRLGLQVLDDRDDFPAVARGVLLPIDRNGGADFPLDEIAHAALPVLLPLGEVEIHLSVPFPLRSRKPSGPIRPRLPSPGTQKIA